MHGVFTRFLKKGIMTLEIECVYKEYNCHVSIELNSVDWVLGYYLILPFTFSFYNIFELSIEKQNIKTP